MTHLYVTGAEEELRVKVELLDDVHVCHVDGPLCAAAHAHHGKVLEQLTADGPRSNLRRAAGGKH